MCGGGSRAFYLNVEWKKRVLLVLLLLPYLMTWLRRKYTKNLDTLNIVNLITISRNNFDEDKEGKYEISG